MLDQPGRSLTELAEHLCWYTIEGQPHKQKVHRVLKDLQKAKLVEHEKPASRNVWAAAAERLSVRQTRALPPVSATRTPRRPGGAVACEASALSRSLP